MTRPVFRADAADLAAAEAGQDVDVAGPEAHHAVTVRRLRVGEEVDLVDGAGRRVTGTVTHAAKDRLTVTATAVTDEPAPTPGLVLVQALAKGGRDEQAVESATELGVDRVVPWQADRSVSRWDGKAAKGRARWAAVAESAAKQSRRARVPQVDDVVHSRGLADAVARALADVGGGAGESTGEGHGSATEVAVLVLHESATERLSELLRGRSGTTTPVTDLREVWFVVGPEGGITDDELASLTRAGATPVLLGPHVLRSSSAGPAAIAALSLALDRW